MKRKVDRSIYRVTKRRFALSRVGPSGSPPLLAEPVFPCPIKDRPVASRCFTREGSRLFLPSPPVIAVSNETKGFDDDQSSQLSIIAILVHR